MPTANPAARRHRKRTVSNGATGAIPQPPAPDGRDPTSGRFTAGNPGKPRGARNRATLLSEVLRDGEDQMLLRDVVETALAGDWQAQKMVFRVLAPARRDAPILMAQLFDVERLTTSAEAVRAATEIPVLIANAILTPAEGQRFLDVLERIEAKLRTAEYQAAQREREKKEAEQRRALLGLERKDRKGWLVGTAWPAPAAASAAGSATPQPAPSAPAGSTAAPGCGPPPSRPRGGAASNAGHS